SPNRDIFGSDREPARTGSSRLGRPPLAAANRLQHSSRTGRSPDHDRWRPPALAESCRYRRMPEPVLRLDLFDSLRREQTSALPTRKQRFLVETSAAKHCRDAGPASTLLTCRLVLHSQIREVRLSLVPGSRSDFLCERANGELQRRRSRCSKS